MNVKASVNYHVKSSEPQAFRFDVDGVEGNLVSPELLPTEVLVKDIRDKTCEVDFQEDGIAFVNAPSQVNTYDPNGQWRKEYDAEIKQLLKSQIAAKNVIVFDHTVRIDDNNAARKPARNVHNDYSSLGATKRLADIVGSDSLSIYQDGHFAFVNVWRPIEFPIKTSPLGFIRPASMLQEDWMNIELIYPHRKGQILGVAPNPDHEWFYQSAMTPDEAIIFNIFDNRGRPHLAHSALDIVEQPETTHPRKSIETRTLVLYSS